jgi:tRNA nucleotidyltransferase (CCA-adding enzyme)
VSAERFPIERVPPAVAAIAQRLIGAGHEAWYVGGAVRDALYEAATGKAVTRTGDYDIATSAPPPEVRSLFRRTVPIGIEHGTVAVLDEGGGAHEVTTFRKDVRTDGRHAEVEFGVSLEEDLARRDFTINAVAVHPGSGEMRDPFDGRGDLGRGVVRAVGDAATRFREDRLRVLRALRFGAAPGFTIEPETWAAVTASAHELSHLSRERVREEWVKMLLASAPARGIGLWLEAGVLGEIWPELASLDAARVAALDGVQGADPVTLTAAALAAAGAGSETARHAAARLRFSNRDAERIEAVVAALARPLPDPEDEIGVRRWLAANLTHYTDISRALPARFRDRLVAAVIAVRLRGAPLSLEQLAVDGSDLLAAGVKAGPAVGRILRRMLDEVLEDPARNTREYLLTRPYLESAD